MTTSASFTTSTGLSGTWPQPPAYWSYSTLVDVARCPRQYALRRAKYSGLWDRAGYPDRVSESSIVGTAVHKGVEAILGALKAARCTSLADPRAVTALRSLGGYTAVAARAVQSSLADLADNPRMAPHMERLRGRLERRAPEMRRAIQALVSRMPVVPKEVTLSADVAIARPRERVRLGSGAHPEVTLVAADARFTGRIDLLTVHPDHADILDFKTGQPAEDHATQLALYGLLWLLDDVANPSRLPIGSLKIAYVGNDRSVPVPQDLESMRGALEERIRQADQALRAVPPAAKPSIECWRCPVRHMCDDYWASTFATRDPGSPFIDVEVVVLRRNGPRSWFGRLVRGSGDALLRTTAEGEVLQAGQQLRVLDAAAGHVDDEPRTVITVTGGSELYSVTPP